MNMWGGRGQLWACGEGGVSCGRVGREGSAVGVWGGRGPGPVHIPSTMLYMAVLAPSLYPCSMYVNDVMS